VTKLDAAREEIAHLWPSFLPDGRRFLYLARSRHRDNTGIYVGSLDSTTQKRLVSADSSAVYAAPGHLLYWHEGGLLAQPFDADRLEITGEPVRVAESVRIEQNARALFSVSTNGLLAYRAGGRLETELVWFDRQGRTLGTVGSPGRYAEPALSPDGNRLAVSRIDPATETRDIWLFDLLRGTSSRFTFDRSNDTFPIWSPAGDRILFLSDRGGRARFYVKSSIGGAEERPLSLDTPEDKILDDWSKDGHVVFETTRTMELSTNRSDLWLLSLSGEHRPVPLEQTEFTEKGGRISPDGRFLAYVSDESGREEVYVRSFPEPGGKWQVSTDGGDSPSWRADGRELFFGSTSLMAAEVEPGATFRVGPPRPLFRTRVAGWTAARNLYAPSPDGQRFLVSTLPEETSTAPIVVVVNWMAALKR
jgi:Tol biopolymer transport system component